MRNAKEKILHSSVPMSMICINNKMQKKKLKKGKRISDERPVERSNRQK